MFYHDYDLSLRLHVMVGQIHHDGLDDTFFLSRFQGDWETSIRYSLKYPQKGGLGVQRYTLQKYEKKKSHHINLASIDHIKPYNKDL